PGRGGAAEPHQPRVPRTFPLLRRSGVTLSSGGKSPYGTATGKGCARALADVAPSETLSLPFSPAPSSCGWLVDECRKGHRHAAEQAFHAVGRARATGPGGHIPARTLGPPGADLADVWTGQLSVDWTSTVRTGSTSANRWTRTSWVPRLRMGSSRWTSCRSIRTPHWRSISSAMSLAVTLPKSLPSSPAWARIVIGVAINRC